LGVSACFHPSLLLLYSSRGDELAGTMCVHDVTMLHLIGQLKTTACVQASDA
jgi:hypothetical protein